jgi:hypothetical protein
MTRLIADIAFSARLRTATEVLELCEENVRLSRATGVAFGTIAAAFFEETLRLIRSCSEWKRLIF